jgi:hypothetical protein
VYHVQAAGYTGANSKNTKIYTPVYTALAGIGGTFTITFDDRISGSFALGAQVSSLGLSTNPAITSTFSTMEVSGWKFAPVFPNPSRNDSYLSITAPQNVKVVVEVVNAVGQMVYRQNEQLNAGKSQIRIKGEKLTNGAYRVQVKDEAGATLNSQQLIKN